MPKPIHPRPQMPDERLKTRPVASVDGDSAASQRLNETIQFATNRRLATVAGEGVERRLLEALLTEDPLVRAKAAQKLLPVVGSLKEMAYELRSDAVLVAWESGTATYRELAKELGVSKSLIQIMVREAREQKVESSSENPVA